MQFTYKISKCFWVGILSICFCSCTKLVKVSEPVNTITTAETFNSDATATSAVMGIYNDIVTGHAGGGNNLSYGNGLLTFNAGMSADELNMLNGPSLFEINALQATNFPEQELWNNPYYDIYLANAAIEGLSISLGVSDEIKKQLTGEAKFIRAFCYFYLVNLFGDVPLALTTAYATTDTLSRAPAEAVYKQIQNDLEDAVSLLASDYSISKGARIRVNKFGAVALLARVYLYQKQWAKAEASASTVIGDSQYQLSTDLNRVFLANSTETILQWHQNGDVFPFATAEAYNLLPTDFGNPPGYYFTPQLLNSFEAGDLRRVAWVDSVNNGSLLFYPCKYKVRVGAQGNVTEFTTVLRLAEQYLIRAEARAFQNNTTEAINDLNEIRKRAELPGLSFLSTKEQVLDAVAQERKIELFAEWGHRWLDLKRTGKADSVLSLVKTGWLPSKKLYPIPAGELINDVKLIQNPGY